MKPSEKLKMYREMLGKNPNEMSGVLGLSVAEYYDLEGFDDLENCIDIGRIRTLASVFGIQSAALFTDEIPNEKISPTMLASLLKKAIGDKGLTLSEAEDSIGWTLGPFLLHPDSEILSWNMTCLYDVCRWVGCSWKAILNGIESNPDNSGHQ